MDWLTPVGHAGITVTAVVLLFEGARRITLQGFHRVALLFVVPGIFICFLYAGGSYWKHTIFASVDTTTRNRPELPDDWRKDLAPNKRQDDSLKYARLVFLSTGELRTYFATSGTRTRYTPNEEEMQERKLRVAIDQFLRTSARQNLDDSIVWLVILLLTPIFGYNFATGQRRALRAKSTAEPDPRNDAHRSP